MTTCPCNSFLFIYYAFLHNKIILTSLIYIFNYQIPAYTPKTSLCAYLCNSGNMENTAMLDSHTPTKGVCLVSKKPWDFTTVWSLNSLVYGLIITAGDEIPPRCMTTGIATSRIDFSWTCSKRLIDARKFYLYTDSLYNALQVSTH